MKRLLNQGISLSVMLVLIAVLISLLPERSALQQAQDTPADGDSVAANAVTSANTTELSN